MRMPHLNEDDYPALAFMSLMLLILALLGPMIYFDEMAAIADLNNDQVEELRDFRLELSQLEMDDFVSIETDRGFADYIVASNDRMRVWAKSSDFPNADWIQINPMSLASAREWSQKITFITKKGDDGWEALARHFFLC